MVSARAFRRTISVGLILAAALLAIGCQAGAHKPSPGAVAGTVSEEGIACDKCKVTWVKMTTRNPKSRVVGYSHRKQMVCPECKDVVENLFTTGKFEHTCSACGGNMAACAMH